MQLTAAKALVRNYFYQEFLPAQLPPQLLRGANYLVLLGDAGQTIDLGPDRADEARRFGGAPLHLVPEQLGVQANR